MSEFIYWLSPFGFRKEASNNFSIVGNYHRITSYKVYDLENGGPLIVAQIIDLWENLLWEV
jgi:hypothetical protein